MDLVTYLLGAGASAQCLPVVKDLAHRIKYASSVLNTLNYTGEFSSILTVGEEMFNEHDLVAEICDELNWMASACEKHSSIDTFAKKLFILKSADYNKLKLILSIYFTLEQKFKSPDLRYDNFWASILDSKDSFPPHLRMVSWNYDFQLEQSYLNFSGNKTLKESYHDLSIRSFCDPIRDQNADKFGIYKLNGSATISQSNDRPTYFSDELSDNIVFYKTLLLRYALSAKTKSYNSNLSFAWEHNLEDSYYRELKLSLWDTKTLVVVGYSFPYFNRKIDRFIINDCMPFLEKVYFQAPDAPNLKERFSAILKYQNSLQTSNLLLRTDLDQFTFPNDL